MTGTLEAIFIADAAGAPMRSFDRVELVSGRGISGDRYFNRTGTYSTPETKPSQEVTLFEAEELDAFNAAHQTRLGADALRRNLVTRGVRLNDLVGHQFAVGDVVLRGLKLCEPCDHLASRTLRTILPGLVHRAGLRAAIVVGGTVHVGAPIGARA